MSIVAKAYKFAEKAHKGQLDDDGNEYIQHLEGVVNILFDLTNNANLIAAAYLHDVIEDTDATYEDVVKEFGKDVAELVHEVTHKGQKDSYGFYFPRLHTKEGIMLKYADRLHNISRMDAWDDKRKAQYLRKSVLWKNGKDL